MSASLSENFKSVFGYHSPDVVDDKKRKVDAVLTRLEKAMESLSESTKQAQMTYHPGKEGNSEKYKSMRTRFNDVAKQNLKSNLAYAAYDAIEKQANTAHAYVFALLESEKRMGDIRRMTPEAIDQMVEDMDTDRFLGAPGSTTGDEDRGILIAAIKVRYNIDELAGDLPDEVLSRFYHVLSLVPVNHTKNNPKLKIIKRSSMDDTSLYYNDGSGTIAINGGDVGGGVFGPAHDKYTDGAGVTMKLNKFDAHTLHEVGHSVDDACGFMKLHGKKAAFGGWKESSFAEAEDVGVKRVKDKYTAIPPAALTRLLRWAMTNKTRVEALEAMKQEARFVGQIGRDELLADKAVQAADKIIEETLGKYTLPLSDEASNEFASVLQIRNILPLSDLKGTERNVAMSLIRMMKDNIRRAVDVVNEIAVAAAALSHEEALHTAFDELADWWNTIKKELWWADSSKIEAVSFGNRVYQHDDGKWWSYDIGARRMMVKDYQFRSPGEWFAEIYAVEMLGKLSDGHPCKGLIRDLDTTQKLTA